MPAPPTRRLRLIATALAACPMIVMALAAPAHAQLFSSSYQFLEAVRERDGTKVTELLGGAGSTLINTRDSSTGESALHIVVARRDAVWLNFLSSRGADTNLADRQGLTPLLVAARIGFVDGAQILLARGARPNLANSSGETPLHFAVQRRDLAMIRTLLAAGADPDLQDNIAGMSPKDYAASDPRASAALALLNSAPAARAAPATGPN